MGSADKLENSCPFLKYTNPVCSFFLDKSCSVSDIYVATDQLVY